MPVLRIHALRPEGLDTPSLLQDCSAAVAKAFACPLEQCWSMFVEVRSGEYLEGGAFRTADKGSHSPIAILSAYQVKDAEVSGPPWVKVKHSRLPAKITPRKAEEKKKQF